MSKTKDQLWEEMNNLISSSEISEKERNLFVTAKTELDKGTDDQRVASTLKGGLSFLSLKHQLSDSSVPFFTELSRLYLGYGRRDNITINPMF